MRKLLITAVALSGITTAVPALAQGYPGSVPQTDVPAKQVYGENHGGWFTALIRGEFSGSTVARNGLPQENNGATKHDEGWPELRMSSFLVWNLNRITADQSDSARASGFGGRRIRPCLPPSITSL